MIEITIYGRGGQGGVTLAKLIATAWFSRDKFVQAFGVYAAERSGAPIQAYVRIDDSEITNHNQIREPNHVVVLDPTLIDERVLTGLRHDGWLILNTPLPPMQWSERFGGRHVATIDATAIAVHHGLGTRTVPIVNTTMMGAVARVLGLAFEEVGTTIADLGFGASDLDAARRAFDDVAFRFLPGEPRRVEPAPPSARTVGLLDPAAGAPPNLRTGTWATRRPQRRTLMPPCNQGCPAGNDVQRFIQAIAHQDISGALAVLLETSPLPGVCGRVCPAPCTDLCNRDLFDEAVNVRELERYAADHGQWPLPQQREQSSSRRVAVVGSGPAGLSAAYHLARLGHHVSLFEAGDQLGGVLRNGIPEYRLPHEVLDRELGFILTHGVVAYTDAPIDRAALRELTARYDAVFVGTGLQESRSLEDSAAGGRVRQGIEFLDSVRRGEASLGGEDVIVIGGGNTAIDAARSARRLGAKSVRIVYRRSRAEMPAIHAEIDAALEEGVLLHELVLPITIDAHGSSARLTCVRMKLGEPDQTGRKVPIRDSSPDAEFVLTCDTVILALGQTADVALIADATGISEAGQLLGMTGAPVFVGGDFGKNEGTVAAAIGSGRRVAWSIHNLFTGQNLLSKEIPTLATSEIIKTRTFANSPRQRGETLDPSERRQSFREVHFGLAGDAEAAAEAQRCFSCGVCNQCDRCLAYCPEGILTRDGDSYRFNYDYCKGCALCASECPRGVIVMAEVQA